MTIEHDVREMLARTAASVTPRAGAMEAIEARLGEPVAVGRRGGRVMVAVAAVVVVAAIGAGLAVRDDPTSVRADGRTTTSITASTVPASADPPAGAWPWPSDEVDAAVLDDPVQTARAYVGSALRAAGGALTPLTTVSELQAGDNNSGEVVFGGDVTTTVFVRRLGDRWHVVGAASDLVTLHDAGDGTVTARVEIAGELEHTRRVWTPENVGTNTSDARRPTGFEVPGLAYDMNTDRAVKAHRFVLTIENPVANPPTSYAIAEVRFAPPSQEKLVAE